MAIKGYGDQKPETFFLALCLDTFKVLKAFADYQKFLLTFKTTVSIARRKHSRKMRQLKNKIKQPDLPKAQVQSLNFLLKSLF